jgi:hypothetical protein
MVKAPTPTFEEDGAFSHLPNSAMPSKRRTLQMNHLVPKPPKCHATAWIPRTRSPDCHSHGSAATAATALGNGLVDRRGP